MGQDQLIDALNKEAQFTCEMLCAGATQIRMANYARRGIYFLAFTSLSTGLERIGKLCLILDYAFKNNGNYPDDNYLKNEIGHDIEKLYKKSFELKNEYKFQFKFLQDLNSDIYPTVLNVLSRFGKGDRYSNIDLIVDRRNYDDPIKIWYENIDLYFYSNLVSKRKKNRIQSNASTIGELIGPSTLVRHTSENETDITDVENASSLTGVFEAVSPIRQLFVIHIIRYWVELIYSIEYKIARETKIEIPSFTEIFRVFYNDDYYIKRRKIWEII